MKKLKKISLIIYIIITIVITIIMINLCIDKKTISKIKKHICIKNDYTISLIGNSTIFLTTDDDFIDPGVKAVDNCNKKVDVDINSTLKVHNEGFYTITYSKNNKSVIRNVIITNEKINSFEEYTTYLNNYLDKYNKTISIGYYNLNTNESFLYRDDKVYYGASLIKTLEALYIYEKDKLTDYSKDLVQKAVSISDNGAHEKLQEFIGFNNVKDFGLSLGAKYTLNGGDTCGMTTINDQIIYYKELYSYITTHDNGDELASYFINDYYNYISLNNGITLLHKYGLWENNFHDAGIFLDGDNPYILVILSNGNYEGNITLFKDISNKMNIYHKLLLIK